MARVEKTIFISYRRKDISWALAVYQYLTSQKYDVFFDYTSIPSGDFEQIIVSNIRARAHFVLILTPTALDRCSEPGDWLRREIETAIDERRNIIPLFFDGFNFGSPSVAEKLTGKLDALQRYNGLDIPSGYFIEAMERLSSRYINIPLDAVLHPVSTEVRKVVKEEQIAVNNALQQKWEEIKEILKPAKEKAGTSEQDQIEKTNHTLFSPGKSPSLRRYGIGVGILLFVALGIMGINALLNGRDKLTPTMTSQVVSNTISVESSVTSSVDTATEEIMIPVISDTTTPDVPTPTAVPTLGIGSKMISDKDSMTLVYVPAGEFMMGLDNDEEDNPAHKVNLDSFWIDQTEVTNAMYARCDEADVCDAPWSNASRTRPIYYGNPDFDDYPVIFVSWNDAKDYCEWAGRRMPTEAEWEKAARGEDAGIYPWGNSAPTIDLSNFGGLIGDTMPVSNFLEGASLYGALNMAGNVWEWVADFYDATYYNKSPSSNPKGPITGQNRVMRGGSWTDYAATIQSVHRFGNYPLDTSSITGFRCAISE